MLSIRSAGHAGPTSMCLLAQVEGVLLSATNYYTLWTIDTLNVQNYWPLTQQYPGSEIISPSCPKDL